MNTDTRIALVTSAGRLTGIGYALAAQLAEQCFSVVLTGRDGQTAVLRPQELSAAA
jgi:NAD(P)-dependent dehydrogenase (short-subunit alcohol dehydrogenase family)